MSAILTDIELLTLIANKLADAKIALFSVQTSYNPKTQKPCIFFKYADAKYANSITLTTYQTETSPDPTSAVMRWRVQVRFRTQGLADNLANTVFNVLEGHFDGTIQRCHRISIAQMGQDATGHDNRSDNYEIITKKHQK